jgi:prolyl-tRNA synthetase
LIDNNISNKSKTGLEQSKKSMLERISEAKHKNDILTTPQGDDEDGDKDEQYIENHQPIEIPQIPNIHTKDSRNQNNIVNSKTLNKDILFLGSFSKSRTNRRVLSSNKTVENVDFQQKIPS